MSRPAPNKEALPIANSQRSSIALEISWQFLTRLVQNLTLRNDCNLIKSEEKKTAHFQKLAINKKIHNFCPILMKLGKND